MISRRNFFSITILMVTMLFLCMCLNNLKDSWNDYAVNRYTETAENYPSNINVYVPDGSREKDPKEQAAETDRGETVSDRDRVVCIGDMNQLSMSAAEAWVTYTKRDIAGYPALPAYESVWNEEDLPEMLVLDSACVDWEAGEEIDFLNTCLEKGVHLVFCNLPDVSVIKENGQARELFGIQKVLEDEITVTNLYLREGFLLGGQTFYREKAGSDADTMLPGSGAFPGERTFPWYIPASGTKVYMKGAPEGVDMDEEQCPIVLWRKSFGTAYVFAVNGGLMEGPEGIGILSAMSAEMHSYEIYPVLNAQNMILTGYPSLADENAAEMERLYSRSVKQVFQEILWPNILMALQKQNYKATCMLTPQYDYSDDNPPDGRQLEYYLKVFNERAVETGWSARNMSGISPTEKLEEDYRFFQDVLGGYDIASFYAGGLEDEQMAEALEAQLLASAKTVVRDYDETESGPVGFLSENVTAQSILGDGLEYTYKNDFRYKCMETALGYFSVSFDMSRVAYPDDDKSAWEQLSRSLATTIDTYGRLFRGFARTTAAECDMRIRQFLALDYSDSRTDDRIRLRTEGIDGPAWFILRTHNEAIREMEGGSWQELEEGAYLIEAAQSEVTLTLEPADERLYR
nr:DUF2194 domain-containing protein [uncultured Acetatifactor sp.]